MTLNNCPICFEDIFFPKKLLCGHNFHMSCIDKWVKKYDTCPCCRSRIDTTLIPSDGIFITQTDIENAKRVSNMKMS